MREFIYYFAGLLIGITMMGIFGNFNADSVARDCFNGTLTTVQDEYIVHSDTGQFFCYTTEWLEANQ